MTPGEIVPPPSPVRDGSVGRWETGSSSRWLAWSPRASHSCSGSPGSSRSCRAGQSQKSLWRKEMKSDSFLSSQIRAWRWNNGTKIDLAVGDGWAELGLFFFGPKSSSASLGHHFIFLMRSLEHERGPIWKQEKSFFLFLSIWFAPSLSLLSHNRGKIQGNRKFCRNRLASLPGKHYSSTIPNFSENRNLYTAPLTDLHSYLSLDF